MKSKLILVEGLPGSGKSTTAQYVRDILSEHGITAELFMEGNLEHPADYDSVAFFSHEDFKEVKEKYSGLLEDSYWSDEEGTFVPYGKLREKHAGTGNGDFFHDLSQHDIYELPFELNRKLITENWERFAEKAMGEEKVYIFECAFIQNPVTVAMIKYGLDNESSYQYIEGLSNAVKSLNPVLIYVQQDNIEGSFRKAVSERPKEWFEGFTHYYTSQGYGKNNDLQGLDGTISVLKARQELESAIYDKLDLDKVIVNNTSFDRESHKENLARQLERFISTI